MKRVKQSQSATYRKGMIESSLVTIITIAAGLAVLLVLYVTFYAASGKDVDYRLCQATLKIQENSMLGSNGLKSTEKIFAFDSPLKTKCVPRAVTVTDTQTLVRAGTATKGDVPLIVYTPSPTDATKLEPHASYDKLNTDVVHSVFAESMRRCWAQGFEGREAIFNDESFFKNSNVCMICDRIEVASDEQFTSSRYQGAGEQDIGLYSNLLRTQMPEPNPDRLTYGEYLFTATPGDDDDETLSGGTLCLNEIPELNPDVHRGTYATVFYRSFSSLSNGCMNTYVVPTSDVRALCDYVVN